MNPGPRVRQHRCPWCQGRLGYLYLARLDGHAEPCPCCNRLIKASAVTVWTRILIMLAAPLLLLAVDPDLDLPTVIFIMAICALIVFFLPIAGTPSKAEPD